MQRGNGAVIGKQNTPTTSVATGVWALNEVQRAVLGGTWPSAVQIDPYFEYNTLLLHGNGTNGAQNNTFLDSSTNNFTITRNGNTTQGTFTPYGSNWSNFFDGSGDYLYIDAASALNLQSGAFTIEFWAFRTTGGVAQTLLSNYQGVSDGYVINVNASNKLTANLSGDVADITGTTDVPINQWFHVAVSGTPSSSVRLFLNGVQEGSTYTGATALDSTRRTAIGAFWWFSNGSLYDPFPGYISNLRFLKGTALYASTFTPPTAPLTAITNTSLLTCQSNRFIDNSSNNFAITRNGDVSVQRFSPFNPTTPYAADVIGGSGYFDGSGDYLESSISNNILPTTGNFTFEGWIYPTASTNGHFAFLRGNDNAYAGIRLQSDGGQINLYMSTDGTSFAINSGAVGSAPVNAWSHIALVRNGGTITLYVNGVSAFTSTAIGSGTALMTGSYNYFGVLRFVPSGTLISYFNGYTSNFRMVSSAVYTSAFTPPTAPLTAITNTTLLLNYSNAAIIDNAMMNDLETVGNAQISTSVSKFGGGSLAFDGSGDILSSPGSQNYVFNGDFTVEGWVYIDSTMASSRPDNLKSFIFVGWNTGNTPQLYVYGTTSTAGIGLGYYDGTTAWDVAATVPKDQWVHIAFARTGSALYGFVNGTRYTINASISATIGSANTFVVGGNPNQVSAYYSYLKGYIDDLRITKGYARYTANFTPPTAPFPDQ